MSGPGRVVLIEPQAFWREGGTRALEGGGYAVVPFAAYPPEERCPPPEAADLVIVGCTRVGDAEARLVGVLRRRRTSVLLLCTLADAGNVRAGFSAGATDVVPRPGDARDLLGIVGRALADGTGGAELRP